MEPEQEVDEKAFNETLKRMLKTPPTPKQVVVKRKPASETVVDKKKPAK